MSRRPRLPALLALAVALTAASGCIGLPEGAADTGDTVTVRYSAHDLATGAQLRNNRSATFAVGSGDSGLGLAFERAVRGHATNDTFSFEVRDDPSLRFGETVEVARELQAIPRQQTGPRDDFESAFGNATVGKTFTAYGFYVGTVTGGNATEVAFTVGVKSGTTQQDPVPQVGVVLNTTQQADVLVRRLDPMVGQTFVVQPPSPFNPTTPLGLDPGSYKVLGATATHLQLSHSASTAADLIGKPLRFTVAILRVVPGDADVEPVDGNYGVRTSPQVNGDPTSLDLGNGPFGGTGHDDGHTH